MISQSSSRGKIGTEDFIQKQNSNLLRIEKKLDILMERSNIQNAFKAYGTSIQYIRKGQRECRKPAVQKHRDRQRGTGQSVGDPQIIKISKQEHASHEVVSKGATVRTSKFEKRARYSQNLGSSQPPADLIQKNPNSIAIERLKNSDIYENELQFKPNRLKTANADQTDKSSHKRTVSSHIQEKDLRFSSVNRTSESNLVLVTHDAQSHRRKHPSKRLEYSDNPDGTLASGRSLSRGKQLTSKRPRHQSQEPVKFHIKQKHHSRQPLNDYQVQINQKSDDQGSSHYRKTQNSLNSVSRSMRMQKKANNTASAGQNYMILGINTQEGSNSHKNSPNKFSGQKRKFLNTTYVTATNQGMKNINFKDDIEGRSRAGIRSQFSKKAIDSEEREIQRMMIKPGRHSRLDPLIMTGKVPRENKSHFELKTSKHNILASNAGLAELDISNHKPRKGDKKRPNENSSHRNRTSKSQNLKFLPYTVA